MTTIALFNRLADRRQREAAAAELARHWRAEALIVFIPDRELGTLRPAPGFRQTLPGGPEWRHFLAACRQPGEHRGAVPFPERGHNRAICAHVGADGAVLALLGGTPTLSRDEFARLPFPLLSALFCAEAAETAAAGLAAASREATRRATALTAALDCARSETDAKAAELEAAVAEMVRLNRRLQDLNDTLEERVRERGRALERQTEERLKAETALHQMQKMDALGQITGGVAHDFNNVLAIIIGSLDLVETLAGRNPRLLRAVAMAQGAAKRAARLIEQLLAFGRRQMLRPQTIDVNEAIRDYHTLLRRAVGEAVEIRTALSPIPCRVHIDPVQFETAILNLAINARDAMPSGGILEIETAVCRGEPPGLAPGDHVRVTVRDHGQGMPAELVGRAFEPFFTTKPMGKGTGLGLSQVYGFVRQSDGRVELESGLGKGTAVRIYLPLHSAPPRPTPGREAAEPAPRSAAAETILVVEDDPDVRDIALSNLEGLGYRTLVAQNGAEALAMLNRNPEVDLLFTDLVMPGGVSGRELARAACRLRPGLKILLTSGYAAPSEDDGAHEDFPLIPKPYRQRDLAAKIRDVLDGAAEAKRARS
ncbi:MAG TPA: ATP-binding protein [Stellaceae bacterium]|nr:ATP-binding protein [Stellaceae bacterium]